MNIDIYLENKKKQMNNCNHLFIKLKEGNNYSGYNSSDYGNEPCVVECLYCGLTNKYIEMDDISKKYNTILRHLNYSYNKLIEINDNIFKTQFNHAYRRSGKSFDNKVFNLLSDQVFNCNHSKLLYELAKNISPNTDNNEIFNIMQTLLELETPLERNQTTDIEQLNALLERYNTTKKKVLKYDKK